MLPDTYFDETDHLPPSNSGHLEAGLLTPGEANIGAVELVTVVTLLQFWQRGCGGWHHHHHRHLAQHDVILVQS